MTDKDIEKIIELKKKELYSESEKNFSDAQIIEFLYRSPCNVTVFTVIQDSSGERIEIKLRDIIGVIERQEEKIKEIKAKFGYVERIDNAYNAGYEQAIKDLGGKLKAVFPSIAEAIAYFENEITGGGK